MKGIKIRVIDVYIIVVGCLGEFFFIKKSFYFL